MRFKRNNKNRPKSQNCAKFPEGRPQNKMVIVLFIVIRRNWEIRTGNDYMSSCFTDYSFEPPYWQTSQFSSIANRLEIIVAELCVASFTKALTCYRQKPAVSRRAFHVAQWQCFFSCPPGSVLIGASFSANFPGGCSVSDCPLVCDRSVWRQISMR
jgi:hypothetical protein